MKRARNALALLFAGFLISVSGATMALELPANQISAAGGTPLQPAPGPDITTNFTCSSKTGVCKCQGKDDCFNLGKSGLCVDGTEKDGSAFDSTTCEFKFKDKMRKPIKE